MGQIQPGPGFDPPPRQGQRPLQAIPWNSSCYRVTTKYWDTFEIVLCHTVIRTYLISSFAVIRISLPIGPTHWGINSGTERIGVRTPTLAGTTTFTSYGLNKIMYQDINIFFLILLVNFVPDSQPNSCWNKFAHWTRKLGHKPGYRFSHGAPLIPQGPSKKAKWFSTCWCPLCEWFWM